MGNLMTYNRSHHLFSSDSAGYAGGPFEIITSLLRRSQRRDAILAGLLFQDSIDIINVVNCRRYVCPSPISAGPGSDYDPPVRLSSVRVQQPHSETLPVLSSVLSLSRAPNPDPPCQHVTIRRVDFSLCKHGTLFGVLWSRQNSHH